jgi:hypothetical protein
MSAEEKKDKVWGTVNYVGSTTKAAACCGFLCFCIPGCLILLCPMVRTTTIRKQMFGSVPSSKK